MVQIAKTHRDELYAASILKTRVLLRKFDYNSLIHGLIRHINQAKFDPKAKTQDLPWVAERILIWLLSDHPRSYGAQAADNRNIPQLIHHAWNETKSLGDQSESMSNYRLSMRSWILPQLPFQSRHDLYPLVWQLALLDSLQSNSRLLQHFNTEAGCAPAGYLELGFFFSVPSQQQKSTHDEIDADSVREFSSIFSVDEQLIVLKQASRTVNELHDVYSTRTIRAEEWFWPNPFAEAPFLKTKKACIPLGAHNIQRHVNTRLVTWAAMKADLLRDFDELVSRYVGDRLAEVGFTALNESEIRKNSVSQVK